MAPGNEGRAPRLPLGGSCQPNRLTEGESLGILDAAPNEALVVDQRSLLQSASRPAPSQREPLVHPAKLQFGGIIFAERSDLGSPFGRAGCPARGSLRGSGVTITRFQTANVVPSQSACSADSSPKGRAKGAVSARGNPNRVVCTNQASGIKFCPVPCKFLVNVVSSVANRRLSAHKNISRRKWRRKRFQNRRDIPCC